MEETMMEELMALQKRQQQARKRLHRALVKNGLELALIIVILLMICHALSVRIGFNTHASTPRSLISTAANTSCGLGDAVSALAGADVPCALLPTYNVAGAL